MTDELGTFLFDPATNEAIHNALPGIVADALAVLTRLGDGALLIALAVLLYWFGGSDDRHERAMVLAIAVSTLALVAGLKGIFTIERPLYVADLAFAPEEYPGWSTPSAHAMGAAAVYGALAVVMDVGKKWQRYAVAGFLIVTVPLSRVVIGVHYLGDVIAGALLGLLLVAVALRITKKSVVPMFALSLVIAVTAFLLGSSEFTTMSIGASLGGLVVWSVVQDYDPKPYGASILVFAVLLIPLFLALRVFETLVELTIELEVAGSEIPVVAIAETGAYAVVFGLAVAVPVLAERLNDWETVGRIQRALPFDGRTVEPDAVAKNLGD